MPRRLVVLSAQAGRDFDNIIEWTAGNFGRQKAEAYETLIVATLRRLEDGRTQATNWRLTGHVDVRRVPVGDGRIRGAHFLYFQERAAAAQQTVQVVRILHTAMDPTLHLSTNDPT